MDITKLIESLINLTSLDIDLRNNHLEIMAFEALTSSALKLPKLESLMLNLDENNISGDFQSALFS